MIKLLVNGLPNTGKTSMCKGLKEAFIISYDGKPCTLSIPHTDIKEFGSVEELKLQINDKIKAYKEKFKKLPLTLVFDSISRIEDTIERNCRNKYSGFDVWSQVNNEIDTLNRYIEQLLERMNVVVICHITYNEKADKYVETCKGSFAKIGGFLSTVDYAITAVKVGKKYYVQHHGECSRTLLDDMPMEEEADSFKLQDYLDKINKQLESSDKWTI